MSTVFPVGNPVNKTTPGTHVLIIGVSAYPNLLGGTSDLVDDPMGLGQLSSPTISATAFCDWVLGRQPPSQGQVGFNNPRAPLASIEMLLSPSGVYAPHGGEGLQIDVADKAQIENAFEVWRQRVLANPQSIGIFYFCGHGVMASSHHLLASDFGDNLANPWSKAFDLSLTVRALEREVSGPLYFFIDACRQIPRSFAAALGATPQALRVVQLTKHLCNSSRLVLQAAGEGALAFAVSGKVSRFTGALIKALSGYTGKKSPGVQQWEVTGEELAQSVRRIVEHENKTIDRRQLVEQELIGPTVLHVETTQPRVMVNLDLLPAHKRQAYRLFWRSVKVGGPCGEFEAQGCPWRTEVPSGFYDIGATAPAGGTNALLISDEQLDPPLYNYQFEA